MRVVSWFFSRFVAKTFFCRERIKVSQEKEAKDVRRQRERERVIQHEKRPSITHVVTLDVFSLQQTFLWGLFYCWKHSHGWQIKRLRKKTNQEVRENCSVTHFPSLSSLSLLFLWRWEKSQGISVIEGRRSVSFFFSNEPNEQLKMEKRKETLSLVMSLNDHSYSIN